MSKTGCIPEMVGVSWSVVSCRVDAALFIKRYLTEDEWFCIHFCCEVKVAALRKSGVKRYGLASNLTSFGFANSNDLFCLRLLICQVTSDGMRG